MRELASVTLAVLVSGGLLGGLAHATYAARPTVGAETRAMQPDSTSSTQGHTLRSTGSEQPAEPSLPAPRPAVVVRVLTLDLTDPWQPAPVALGRPAWSATREQQATAYGDHAAALRGYGELEDLWTGSDRSSNRLADYDLTVATRDRYAYVTAGDAGLRILDYTAPASERREHYFATPGAAEAVLVAGDQAYVVVLQHVPAYSGYD
jgi:hypothetical protein